jgi:hypothetical protein
MALLLPQVDSQVAQRGFYVSDIGKIVLVLYLFQQYLKTCEKAGEQVPPARLTLHSTKLCIEFKICRKKSPQGTSEAF